MFEVWVRHTHHVPSARSVGGQGECTGTYAARAVAVSWRSPIVAAWSRRATAASVQPRHANSGQASARRWQPRSTRALKTSPCIRNSCCTATCPAPSCPDGPACVVAALASRGVGPHGVTRRVRERGSVALRQCTADRQRSAVASHLLQREERVGHDQRRAVCIARAGRTDVLATQHTL